MEVGGRGVVRVGLLGRSGAGTCPNLLQRRPGPESAVRRSAEYQRFSSGAPARSGPLQQIWTNGAVADPGRGGRGPAAAPPASEHLLCSGEKGSMRGTRGGARSRSAAAPASAGRPERGCRGIPVRGRSRSRRHPSKRARRRPDAAAGSRRSGRRPAPGAGGRARWRGTRRRRRGRGLDLGRAPGRRPWLRVRRRRTPPGPPGRAAPRRRGGSGRSRRSRSPGAAGPAARGRRAPPAPGHAERPRPRAQ